MLDPKKTMENFEALDSEIARLRAENARLREALQSIADHDRDITGAPAMVEIAQRALTETEAS